MFFDVAIGPLYLGFYVALDNSANNLLISHWLTLLLVHCNTLGFRSRRMDTDWYRFVCSLIIFFPYVLLISFHIPRFLLTSSFSDFLHFCSSIFPSIALLHRSRCTDNTADSILLVYMHLRLKCNLLPWPTSLSLPCSGRTRPSSGAWLPCRNCSSVC
jgi:hypothetical protein